MAGKQTATNNNRGNQLQGLLRHNPALFRKLVLSALATLGVFAFFFGLDLLDWMFMTQDGVSALEPVRAWFNESMGAKLILLLAWGWAVSDLAFVGGEAMTVGPYRRFARHLDQVPGHLVPFHLREGDEHFRVIANAYNAMVVRLTGQEAQLQSFLQTAAEKKYSAERIRREIQEYIGEHNES